jgi:alanine racemase
MMEELHRPTVAEIRLANLESNGRLLQKISSPTAFFCPMVKANAYGHGDLAVSRAMVRGGVNALGVALIEEGIQLRENRIVKPEILVFYPYLAKDVVDIFKRQRLTPVVSSWESLRALGDCAMEVHLKFNTGMNRVGFSISESQRVTNYLKRRKKLRAVGVCTHLLSGEDFGERESRSAEQSKQFAHLVETFSNSNQPIKAHIFNSGALVARHCMGLKDKSDWGARPGIALYGVKPVIESKDLNVQNKWQKIALKPVMQVRSQVVQVQAVKKGETVSYDGTFVAPRDSQIGVVPIGYADGYLRAFSNKGYMLCRGQPVPVVGTVCMDFTMIDLTDVARSKKRLVGEEVVILGQQGREWISAEDLAIIAKTNSYEILTGFSSRVPRVYV